MIHRLQQLVIDIRVTDEAGELVVIDRQEWTLGGLAVEEDALRDRVRPAAKRLRNETTVQMLEALSSEVVVKA